MGLLTRFSAAFYSALDLHVRRYALEWSLVALILMCAAFSAYLTLAPPRPYPVGSVLVVAEGASAEEVAQELYKARLVRYPQPLVLWWRITGTSTLLAHGAYRFAEPENAITIARRIGAGDYGIPSVKLTFPEGTTVLDMGRKIAKALPTITLSDFIAAAGPYEGYLYPDTYSFQPSATAASVVERMQKEFNENVEPLSAEIAASGRTLQEIVIMASIIEREARREADRKMISGILWNRIEKDMPLQVDAVFGYIYSRQTFSPSFSDLKVDSPYNTYYNAGLPPGPICNPSLSSIEAALRPTPSKYLYYLTGRDGLMRYGVTYKQHEANINAYLR